MARDTKAVRVEVSQHEHWTTKGAGRRRAASHAVFLFSDRLTPSRGLLSQDAALMSNYSMNGCSPQSPTATKKTTMSKKSDTINGSQCCSPGRPRALGLRENRKNALDKLEKEAGLNTA